MPAVERVYTLTETVITGVAWAWYRYCAVCHSYFPLATPPEFFGVMSVMHQAGVEVLIDLVNTQLPLIKGVSLFEQHPA